MPYWTMKQYNNDKGTIAGWGFWVQNHVPTRPEWNKDLKKVDTLIYSNEFCKAIMKNNNNDNPWHTITEYDKFYIIFGCESSPISRNVRSLVSQLVS